MQRLALFDLDQTLVDRDGAFLLWAEEFAAEHGLGGRAVRRLVETDRNGLAQRELFFVKVRERFRLSISAQRLWAGYRERMPSLVRCFPGVLEGLAELRADGWRVGVVTNGAADNQVGKLERTGLADALDGYAVSGAEGIRKPEAGLFEIAARRCGVSLAGGGWMVGDNLVAGRGWRAGRSRRAAGPKRRGARPGVAGSQGAGGKSRGEQEAKGQAGSQGWTVNRPKAPW